MNIFPFKKRKSADSSSETWFWKENIALAPKVADMCNAPSYDDYDFNEEIEITRSNEPLMAVLKSRAQEPATVSLRDIRKRLELE